MYPLAKSLEVNPCRLHPPPPLSILPLHRHHPPHLTPHSHVDGPLRDCHCIVPRGQRWPLVAMVTAHPSPARQWDRTAGHTYQPAGWSPLWPLVVWEPNLCRGLMQVPVPDGAPPPELLLWAPHNCSLSVSLSPSPLSLAGKLLVLYAPLLLPWVTAVALSSPAEGGLLGELAMLAVLWGTTS